MLSAAFETTPSVEMLVLLAVWIVGLAFAPVAASKGRVWLVALGVLCPVFWFAGALLHARPGSVWERWRGPRGAGPKT